MVAVVSKPGDPNTVEALLKRAKSSPKPVVVCVLGDAAADAKTLDAAVDSVVEALGSPATRGPWSDRPHAGTARDGLGSSRFVRGLFSGGSLCAEAQVVLSGAGLEVASNSPLPGSRQLVSGAPTTGHALVDLGTEEFTTGRPHPMIDARVRKEWLLAEASKEDVAVILLDVVLGYNAAADPAGDLAPEIAAVRRAGRAAGAAPLVVASVVGTDADPQVLGRQEATLREAGAVVAPTNALAAEFAADVVRGGLS